ncbi:MAG: ABC transporter permease [Marinilabiliaceae bacterium]
MLSACKDRIRRVLAIAKREVAAFRRRPLLIFCMLVAPIFGTVFFTSLMSDGLPSQMPTGLVDEDDTQTTRSIVRVLSAMKTTRLDHRYHTFSEAREAMQRGDIYAFFYIPEGTTEAALSSRQPQISFYTNDSYYVAGALLMKDLKVISEMAGLAVTKATLQAKGVPDSQIMGVLQPIVIETHPLGNPYLNYGVLLNNLIMPGIVILLVMLTTTYTIGLEWKIGTQRYLLNDLAGGSVPVALTGKLLPQTVIYTFVFAFIDVYFYKFMHYPCQCGIPVMIALGLFVVLAAQSFGIVLFGVFVGQMRMSMSSAALLGVLSVSMAGFSYPVPAMTPLLQHVSWIFPLRNYFLIYANQCLNGYPIVYAWKPILALLIMLAIPFLLIGRYRKAFNETKYVP